MSLSIKNSLPKKNIVGNFFVFTAMVIVVAVAVFVYIGLPAIRLYGASTFTVNSTN
jgi:hypothetical protein